MARRSTRLLSAFLLGALFCGDARAADPTGPTTELVRVGMTRSAAEGNINDVKAATKVWIEGIVDELDLRKMVSADVRVFEDSEGLGREVAAGTIDVIVLSTPDFLAFGGNAAMDEIFAYEKGGTTREQYVVLARKDSGIQTLGDLRGKTVSMLRSIRLSLAESWLDQELVKAGQPKLRQHVGDLVQEEKATRCVHSVFFRKRDACVVNALAYRTICELNPQIGRDLATVSSSPSYVPSLIAIRRGYTSSLRPDLERAIREVHKTPRGQQILTVYMIDRLVEIQSDALESARGVLAGQTAAGEKKP